MDNKIKKCIILARARTGSNLLRSYLNSHPNIQMKGEEFLRVRNKDLDKIMASVFTSYKENLHVQGFKYFYYHPIDNPKAKKRIQHFLKKQKDIFVIHLKRRNMLKILVSLEIANKTDKWIQTTTSESIPLERKQISITPEKCRNFFTQQKQHERQFDRMFAEHIKTDIIYEKLLENPENELSRIQNFLSIEQHQLVTEMKKQNKEPIQSLLVNYNELKESFDDTKFQYLFP